MYVLCRAKPEAGNLKEHYGQVAAKAKSERALRLLGCKDNLKQHYRHVAAQINSERTMHASGCPD